MEVLFAQPWKKSIFIWRRSLNTSISCPCIRQHRALLSAWQHSSIFYFCSAYAALELILVRNNIVTQILGQYSVPENTSQVKSGILVRVGKTANSLLSSALSSNVEKTNYIKPLNLCTVENLILVFHLLDKHLKHPDSTEVSEEGECCLIQPKIIILL